METTVRPAKHGKRWEAADDTLLIEILTKDDGSFAKAADALERTEESVRIRLLGNIVRNKNLDLAERYGILPEHIEQFNAIEEARKERREEKIAEKKAKKAAAKEERQRAQEAREAEAAARREAKKTARQRALAAKKANAGVVLSGSQIELIHAVSNEAYELGLQIRELNSDAQNMTLRLNTFITMMNDLARQNQSE